MVWYSILNINEIVMARDILMFSYIKEVLMGYIKLRILKHTYSHD